MPGAKCVLGTIWPLPQYNLPADTIDLLDHVVRTNAGNAATQSDLTINRISVSTYAAIPNKLTTGRPIQVWIERLTAQPRINVWPVPSDGSYTFVYWRMRRVQDAGNGVETADMSFRFLPALVAGLAYHIAVKVPEPPNTPLPCTVNVPLPTVGIDGKVVKLPAPFTY